MKTVVQRRFMCDKCRAVYDSTESAIQCEESHKDPIYIDMQSADYVCRDDDLRVSYPAVILVRMSSGLKVPYKLAHPGESQHHVMIHSNTTVKFEEELK